MPVNARHTGTWYKPRAETVTRPLSRAADSRYPCPMQKIPTPHRQTAQPDHPPAPFVPQIRIYQDWLARTKGLRFEDYDALWAWSVSDLDGFWQSIWDYFAMQSPTPHSAVLKQNTMPGAVWFEGARVNYAQQVFRHVAPADAAGLLAIISRNEVGEHREISWPELRRQVASLALHLRAQGVQPGDRVAGHKCGAGPLPANHAQGADCL